jgi:hypothetical protein
MGIDTVAANRGDEAVGRQGRFVVVKFGRVATLRSLRDSEIG